MAIWLKKCGKMTKKVWQCGMAIWSVGKVTINQTGKVPKGISNDVIDNMAISLTAEGNCHFSALGRSVSLQVLYNDSKTPLNKGIVVELRKS